MAFRYGDFPCHRVVNHQGRITPGWPEQVDLLKEDAFLKLEVKTFGVHSWEEVQYNELPEKVQANYTK